MAHLEMQAALQPYIDNSISKTINIPAGYPFTDFQALYEKAFSMNLKGCTTFRPNAITGAVLTSAANEVRHCCVPNRKLD